MALAHNPQKSARARTNVVVDGCIAAIARAGASSVVAAAAAGRRRRRRHYRNATMPVTNYHG